MLDTATFGKLLSWLHEHRDRNRYASNVLGIANDLSCLCDGRRFVQELVFVAIADE